MVKIKSRAWRKQLRTQAREKKGTRPGDGRVEGLLGEEERVGMKPVRSDLGGLVHSKLYTQEMKPAQKSQGHQSWHGPETERRLNARDSVHLFCVEISSKVTPILPCFSNCTRRSFFFCRRAPLPPSLFPPPSSPLQSVQRVFVGEMQSLARATGRAMEHASCLRPRNVALLSRRGRAVAMKAAAVTVGDAPLVAQGVFSFG